MFFVPMVVGNINYVRCVFLLCVSDIVIILNKLVEKIDGQAGDYMEKIVYVMLIERGKTYNRINKEMVIKHVERIKKLDDDGKLVLGGATEGCSGVAGVVVFRAGSQEEAEEICKLEPFVIEGYATYKLIRLRVGDKDNNYLLQ